MLWDTCGIKREKMDIFIHRMSREVCSWKLLSCLTMNRIRIEISQDDVYCGSGLVLFVEDLLVGSLRYRTEKN